MPGYNFISSRIEKAKSLQLINLLPEMIQIFQFFTVHTQTDRYI